MDHYIHFLGVVYARQLERMKKAERERLIVEATALEATAGVERTQWTARVWQWGCRFRRFFSTPQRASLSQKGCVNAKHNQSV